MLIDTCLIFDWIILDQKLKPYRKFVSKFSCFPHVLHNLCVFWGVDPLHSQIKDLDWRPSDHRDYSHFQEEHFVHVGSLEVRLEQKDTHEVGHCSADLD